MMPIIQTRIVRVTSQIERAKALIYFVTVTAVTLKVAIVNTPKIQKNNSAPLDPKALKYVSGLSMKGMPAELKTQVSTPKLHGTKVMMIIKISWAASPNIP